MARSKLPICPEIPQKKNLDVMRFTIELITPLFGGGTVAKEIDRDLLIRATEIRGLLRFWWRATRGKCFLTEENPIGLLKQKEEEIWGSTSRPSPFSLVVEDITFNKNSTLPNIGSYKPDEDDNWKYILFPFEDGRGRNRKIVAKTNSGTARISFQLRVMQNSGCGALYCHNAKLFIINRQ